MSAYPTLNQMGIPDPEDIDRYSLQTINSMDHLRIVYKRKAGAILPSSKRFRFPRVEKLSPGGNDSQDNQMYSEISPVVHQAMVELDQIVHSKRDRAHQLEVIKEEMHRLQEETSTRIAYINSLVKEIE